MHTDDAVRAAYRRHGGELHGFARRSLRDDGLAQDAVQETFVRAWRARERFDPAVASERTWLFAICRNVVVDLVRRAQVRPAVASERQVEAHEHASTAPGADPAETVVRRSMLRTMLDELPREQRDALTGMHLEARTSEEIAAELGISPSAVRNRAARALRRLREGLGETAVLTPDDRAGGAANVTDLDARRRRGGASG